MVFEKLLFPVLKKFKGLFISMSFVTLLSITLFLGFTNAMTNLNKAYGTYKERFGAADVITTTEFMRIDETVNEISSFEEVEVVDSRLKIDVYMRVENRNVISRMFTYHANSKIFKRYISKELDRNTLSEEDKLLPTISIEKKLSDLNKIKVGDTVKFGYFNFYFDFIVDAIVQTPESMSVRASDYIWSNNRDFGYVYINQSQLGRFLNSMAKMVKEKVDDDPAFKEIYEEAISALGLNVPDYRDLIDDTAADEFANIMGNQILVKSKKGVDNEALSNKIKDHIEGNGHQVVSSQCIEQSLSELTIEASRKQLWIAVIFLPIFFFSIALVITVLFINQIIKSMTSDIGIMMSIGVSKIEITSIYSMFIFLMSVVSSIFGVAGGYGLLFYLSTIFKNIYYVPIINSMLNPILVAVAVIAVIIVGQVAVLISSSLIYKITPKDAMVSNESKRNKVPKWLSKFIDKAPMNIKLGSNTIAQNPRRFFVSSFSIFVAFVLIIITASFYVSTKKLVSQTYQRIDFTSQVYLTEIDDGSFLDELKLQSFINEKDGVKQIEEAYYTFLQVEKGDKKIYYESLAIDVNRNTDMIYIPGKDGKTRINIEENGIVVNTNLSKTLKVKVGDVVTINSKEVVITGISDQYFHFVIFMSKTQMSSLTDQYVTSYFIDTSDEIALSTYVGEEKLSALTVSSKALRGDLEPRFAIIDIFIFILIGFALSMAFVILVIMSQNALMEQKRQISILRSIGFTLINVSNLWMIQSISQLIVSTILAIPVGVIFCSFLFSLASTTTVVYPYIFSIGVMALSFLFILVVIALAHLISMVTINRWNLADNTRSRE